MHTLLVTTPQANTAEKTVRAFLPQKLPGWRIQVLSSDALRNVVEAPDVTLVHLNNETRPADLKAIMPCLVRIQGKAPSRSQVVFSLKILATTEPQRQESTFDFREKATRIINEQLQAFPNPDHVSLNFVQTRDDLPPLLAHFYAKLDLARSRSLRPLPSETRPIASPLDGVKRILDATADLRIDSGRLSAEAVASAFGISMSQLADWLGRSRQALGKTPDAVAVQSQLEFFERVARLRTVLPNQFFVKWLRMPISQLDGKTPLDLLSTGERQVVADFVDDMLTGAPT